MRALPELRGGAGAASSGCDGEPWRTLPAGAVVAAACWSGRLLDRERARELRRGVRRAGGPARTQPTRFRGATGRPRVSRPSSKQRGIAGPERVEAVKTLLSLGYVDDARFAARRAATLAARGHGDEAIRFDLDRQGLDREQVEAALATLAPERERASAIAARSSDPLPKTARRLATKGFSAESIESALGVLDV